MQQDATPKGKKVIVMCYTQGRNMYVASLAVAAMTDSTT
jgi:hypothetical protein